MSDYPTRNKMVLHFVASLFLFAAFFRVAQAQELVPRAYEPAPVGLNAFTLAYAYSFGDILFDPSLPIKDANARLNNMAGSYYRTFGLFGRFANFTVAQPYAFGHISGTVADEPREIYRSGLADLRFRFQVNLVGTSALTMAEFVKHRRKTNMGVSLTVSAPTGQYDPSKLINIGQNRWAFKPEVGLSRVFGSWQLDAYAGAWLFTANDNFQGKTRTQDPIPSFQFHLTYNIRTGFWCGFNSNFYTGGRTEVNGVPGNDQQRNSRIGGTVAVPIAKRQSMKFTASRGAFISRGGNFTTFGVSYNYFW
jgi:hypothetical protein